MLNPTFRLGNLNLTSAPYLVEFGSDLGAPENVYEVVLSLLQDGDSVVSDRAGNRELTLNVMIEAASMKALAEAEAALIRETEKARNVLTIDPGDGLGAPTAFDTFRAQATLLRNDDEEGAFVRRYSLTLPALPFARSTTLRTTTGEPLPSTATVITIDSCDTLSGSGYSWSADRLSSSSSTEEPETDYIYAANGAVGVNVGISHPRLRLTRTGGISTSLSFLIVEWRANTTSGNTVNLLVDRNVPDYYSGNPLNDASLGGYVATKTSTTTTAQGWNRTTFSIPTPPTQSIALQVDGSLSYLDVNIVEVSDGDGSASRQRSLSLTPGGSVRAHGSIAVSSTSTLGEVVVYTHPGDQSPPLRKYLTTTGATTDASAVSALVNTVGPGSSLTYVIPASAVPEGNVQIWARVKHSASTTPDVSWDVTARMAATAVGVPVSGTTRLTLPATDTFRIVPVGAFSAPLTRTGQNGDVRLLVTNPSGTTGNLVVDEVWLFEVDAGALTVVDVSAQAATKVWIDAPSLDDPLGGVWQGTATDRSNSFHADPRATEPHYFHPDGTNVFLVTTGTTSTTVTLTHYRHWHTHAID